MRSVESKIRALAGAATLCALVGPSGSWGAPAETPATAQGRIVEAAYLAMGLSGEYRLDGGAQARDTMTTLTVKGTMQQWDPGESYSVSDLTKPDTGSSTFTEMWDRSKEGLRVEWVRPRPAGGNRTYTEIIMADGGYVIGNDANGAPTSRAIQGPNNQPLHTMSGLRLAAALREHERNSIVVQMHDNPERVSDYPAQTAGGKRYPAVQYRGDGGTFIVMFDPATKVPAIVRTRDFDYLMGDADYDETLSDWRDVDGGFKYPFHRTYTLNGVKIFDVTLTQADANKSQPADVLRAPRELQGKAAKPAPAGKVPYQWILRRLASGFYLDSDALYTDDGGSLQLTDVAPNISLVTGGSHNTMLVAANDYLVAFEAPGDDGMSQWVIDAAAKKYPGKPIRYLVLTHHHIDHTGGLRAYVAQGASVVVGKGDGAYFRKLLSAPYMLDSYPLKGKVTPKVIEVADKWRVNDGGRAIEAYVIENPHAAGYLIGYIPDAKLGFVTDLWNPGPPIMGPANPNMVAVVKGVQKAGIQPEKFAGGHAAVGSYADLTQAVQRTQANAR